MEVEIRQNHLPKELNWYEDVISHAINWTECILKAKGNDVPKEAKMIVDINAVMNVQFLFENVSKDFERQFLNTLKEYRIL